MEGAEAVPIDGWIEPRRVVER